MVVTLTPHAWLQLDRQLLTAVLDRLTQSDDGTRREEREQALIELINAAGLRLFDPERLLVSAERAGFWAVCEMVLEQQQRYADIIPCFLNDEVRLL